MTKVTGIGSTAIIGWAAVALAAPFIIGAFVVWIIPKIVDVPAIPPSAESGITVETAYARRGQFGDMFGVVTCIFTGISLGLLILNIVLLRKQLVAEKIRGDLSERDSARQEHERHFFRLLDIHRSFENSSHGNVGHIREMMVRFKSALSPQIMYYETTTPDAFKDAARNTYKEQNTLHHDVTSTYVVSCRNIASFIGRAQDGDQRKFFANAFASMLRPIEHEFIYFTATLCNDRPLQELLFYLSDPIGMPVIHDRYLEWWNNIPKPGAADCFAPGKV